MKKKQIRYIAIRALRFCIAFSLFLLISFLAHKTLLISKNLVEYPIEDRVISIVCVVLNLLLYYSVFRSFLLTDLTARNRYFEAENVRKNSFYRFKSVAFAVTLCGTVLIVLLFPRRFGSIEVSYFSELSEPVCRWILLAVYLLLVPVIYLSSVRQWDILKEKGKPEQEHIKSLLTLFGNIGWVFFSYLGIAFFCPMILPAVYSTGRILRVLGYKALFILALIVLLIFAAIGLRAVLIRRRFVRALRKASHANGWKLSEITHPYLSLFLDTDGCSFVLKANGKTYTCKMLSGIRRDNPIRFLENGQCMIIHRIRIRRLVDDIMQFHTQFSYAFAGEGQKVLILSPTPYKMFVTGGGTNHALDIGDRVGEYMIYTGTSFINAIQRDSI